MGDHQRRQIRGTHVRISPVILAIMTASIAGYPFKMVLAFRGVHATCNTCEFPTVQVHIMCARLMATFARLCQTSDRTANSSPEPQILGYGFNVEYMRALSRTRIKGDIRFHTGAWVRQGDIDVESFCHATRKKEEKKGKKTSINTSRGSEQLVPVNERSSCTDGVHHKHVAYMYLILEHSA